ncbi:hypothetical protein K5D34_23005, partial [Pseudomonas cichorii]|nr:hypothetical protein [Pseudomonas cichorii]
RDFLGNFTQGKGKMPGGSFLVDCVEHDQSRHTSLSGRLDTLTKTMNKHLCSYGLTINQSD